MPNDSATGGYLRPTNTVLDGRPLKVFIHDFLVGNTGLDNNLVRAAFQKNSPTIPDIDVDWMAFNIAERRITNTSALMQIGEISVQLVYEDLDVVCYFYGPNCTLNASTLRDALRIGQNLEVLQLNGFGLRTVSDLRYLPLLLNEQFDERCDITVTLTREIRKEYAILPLDAAHGEVIATSGGEQVINDWEV
jgi:hypothetical protein